MPCRYSVAALGLAAAMPTLALECDSKLTPSSMISLFEPNAVSVVEYFNQDGSLCTRWVRYLDDETRIAKIEYFDKHGEMLAAELRHYLYESASMDEEVLPVVEVHLADGKLLFSRDPDGMVLGADGRGVDDCERYSMMKIYMPKAVLVPVNNCAGFP